MDADFEAIMEWIKTHSWELGCGDCPLMDTETLMCPEGVQFHEDPHPSWNGWVRCMGIYGPMLVLSLPDAANKGKMENDFARFLRTIKENKQIPVRMPVWGKVEPSWLHTINSIAQPAPPAGGEPKEGT